MIPNLPNHACSVHGIILGGFVIGWGPPRPQPSCFSQDVLINFKVKTEAVSIQVLWFVSGSCVALTCELDVLVLIFGIAHVIPSPERIMNKVVMSYDFLQDGLDHLR